MYYDFFDWVMMFFIGAVIILVIAMIAFSVIDGNKEREAFMRECLKDHKEYECTAMWRAGDSNVVPMPIIIPMGR